MKEDIHMEVVVNPHTGVTEEGPILDGERDGTWQSWDANGVLLETRFYLKGSREGLWTTWWADGKTQCREIFFEGDVEHGPTTLYHRNGRPFMSGKMNKGRMDGVWSVSNDSGDTLLFLSLINDTLMSCFPPLDEGDDFDGQ